MSELDKRYDALDERGFTTMEESEYEVLKRECSQFGLAEKIVNSLSLDGLIRFHDFVNIKDTYVNFDFDKLISEFFSAIDFCAATINDEKLLQIQHSIEELFDYFKSLDLETDTNNIIIKNFFNRLAGYYTNNDYENFEGKAIYDLLLSPSIKNTRMMREYLRDFVEQPINKFLVENDITMATFTKKLYQIHDTNDGDYINKIDYLFRNSAETFYFFLRNPDSMSSFLNKEFINMFDKETLSAFFRTVDNVTVEDFANEEKKFLTLIKAMSDYLIEHIGTSAPLFNNLFYFYGLHRDRNEEAYLRMKKVFNEYYDKHFDKTAARDLDHDELFLQLLQTSLTQFFDFFDRYVDIEDLDSFYKARQDLLDSQYNRVFANGSTLKIAYGVFDVSKDYRPLKEESDLLNLKKIYFYRLYGLSYFDAERLYNAYGRYLDICSDELLDSDDGIISKLKDIFYVYRLHLTEHQKVNQIKVKLYDYLRQNGLYNVEKDSTFPVIQALANRAYMNSYNDVLFKVDENSDVIDHHRHVPIIDAPVEFNMFVHSTDAVTNFLENSKKKSKRIKMRYNTSLNSCNNGLCMSFINNENLGVLSLNKPLLGYCDIDHDMLGLMGVGDTFSDTGCLDLRGSNLDSKQAFLTPKAFADYTRFGYNEVLINRFYNKKNKDVKVQPSYVVAYKIDDNYQKTRMYKKGLRMASELGIPLVLVDVRKIKRHEQEEIEKQEEELFKKREVNEELLSSIITRYMNNYSGSLTMERSQSKEGNGWCYEADFSIDGLKNFLDKVSRRFQDLSIEEIKSWSDALKKVYYREKQKNKFASEMESYAHSLHGNEFVLYDDINFLETVNVITQKNISRNLMAMDIIDFDKELCIPYRDGVQPSFRLVFNLINKIFKNAYYMIEKNGDTYIYPSRKLEFVNDEDKRNYGLVISYLIGNYDYNYFSDLLNCDAKNVKISFEPQNLREEKEQSPLYSDMKMSSLLNNLIDRVFDMRQDEEIYNDLVKCAKNQDVDSCIANFNKRKHGIHSQFEFMYDYGKKAKVKK